MLSGDPVRKLSMQMTSLPSASSRSQRCEPMKPAPPVTRMRATLRRLHDGAPDRIVREALLAHDVALVEVAPVEDHRRPHQAAHAREIRTAELVPVGHDQERVDALEGIVVDAMIVDAVTEHAAGLAERLGIVGLD